jgi:hypothetical protein
MASAARDLAAAVANADLAVRAVGDLAMHHSNLDLASHAWSISRQLGHWNRDLAYDMLEEEEARRSQLKFCGLEPPAADPPERDLPF